MKNRAIGIVKWFGGFNNKKGKENDYGFIVTEYGSLYVRKDMIISDSSKIIEGRIVTLTVAFSKRKQDCYARNVKTLDDDCQLNSKMQKNLDVFNEVFNKCVEIKNKEKINFNLQDFSFVPNNFLLSNREYICIERPAKTNLKFLDGDMLDDIAVQEGYINFLNSISVENLQHILKVNEADIINKLDKYYGFFINERVLNNAPQTLVEAIIPVYLNNIESQDEQQNLSKFPHSIAMSYCLRKYNNDKSENNINNLIYLLSEKCPDTFSNDIIDFFVDNIKNKEVLSLLKNIVSENPKTLSRHLTSFVKKIINKISGIKEYCDLFENDIKIFDSIVLSYYLKKYNENKSKENIDNLIYFLSKKSQLELSKDAINFFVDNIKNKEVLMLLKNIIDSKQQILLSPKSSLLKHIVVKVNIIFLNDSVFDDKKMQEAYCSFLNQMVETELIKFFKDNEVGIINKMDNFDISVLCKMPKTISLLYCLKKYNQDKSEENINNLIYISSKQEALTLSTIRSIFEKEDIKYDIKIKNVCLQNLSNVTVFDLPYFFQMEDIFNFLCDNIEDDYALKTLLNILHNSTTSATEHIDSCLNSYIKTKSFADLLNKYREKIDDSVFALLSKHIDEKYNTLASEYACSYLQNYLPEYINKHNEYRNLLIEYLSSTMDCYKKDINDFIINLIDCKIQNEYCGVFREKAKEYLNEYINGNIEHRELFIKYMLEQNDILNCEDYDKKIKSAENLSFLECTSTNSMPNKEEYVDSIISCVFCFLQQEISKNPNNTDIIKILQVFLSKNKSDIAKFFYYRERVKTAIFIRHSIKNCLYEQADEIYNNIFNTYPVRNNIISFYLDSYLKNSTDKNKKLLLSELSSMEENDIVEYLSYEKIIKIFFLFCLPNSNNSLIKPVARTFLNAIRKKELNYFYFIGSIYPDFYITKDDEYMAKIIDNLDIYYDVLKIEKEDLSTLLSKSASRFVFAKYIMNNSSNRQNAKKLFMLCDEDTQILLTYALLKYNNIQKLDLSKNDFDENSKIYLIYIFIDAIGSNEKEKINVWKNEFLVAIHKRIMNTNQLSFKDDIIENGIDMTHILPLCIFKRYNHRKFGKFDSFNKCLKRKQDKLKEFMINDKNFYCEGAISAKKANNIFCIRYRDTGVYECQERYSEFYPNLGKEYADWSIAEVMFKTGFWSDNIINIYKNSTDRENKTSLTMKNCISKLCGIHNRVNELLHKMRCRYCGKIMKFNLERAYMDKFFAAYSVTEASCIDDDVSNKHDKNIYFNHCLCCRKVIDSRECQQCEKCGYYICPLCGACKCNHHVHREPAYGYYNNIEYYNDDMQFGSGILPNKEDEF
jgi:hypothetical protein